MVQFTFLGEEALCAEGKPTFWNPITNASVAAAEKRSIDEIIALYTPTTRLLQVYLEEDGARVWPVNWRALLNVWLGCNVALLSLNAAYGDKFQCCVLGVDFYKLESISRHSMDTMTSHQLRHIGVQDYSRLLLRKKERFFCKPRFLVLCFPHCSEEKRIEREASDEGCRHFGLLCICGTRRSSTWRGWMGREHPFAQLCLGYFSCTRGVSLHSAHYNLFIRRGWRWIFGFEGNPSVTSPIWSSSQALLVPRMCTYNDATKYLNWFSSQNERIGDA